MQMYCWRNGRSQGDHHIWNRSKVKTEGNIAIIVIIVTVGANERTTEKLFLAVNPHRLRNSHGTHPHRWSGRVDEGDTLLLAFPPHIATSRPLIHLLIRHHCTHRHQQSI